MVQNKVWFVKQFLLNIRFHDFGIDAELSQ